MNKKVVGLGGKPLIQQSAGLHENHKNSNFEVNISKKFP
jgi:hypothetical protein